MNKEVFKTRFSRVYVEISNICNLSCSFCVGNTRPNRVMTPDEFADIVSKLQPYTKHIYLHVLGEPLLHPQLAQLLEVANSAQMHVNITTNGTLLAKNTELLCNAPAVRKVSVSLHSLEPESHIDPAVYLRDVANFALRAEHLYCELRLWNLGGEGIDNVSIFEPLCDNLGIDRIRQQDILKTLHESGSIALRPRLFLGKAQRFAWPSLTAPYTNQPVFCHGLRTQIAVLADGTVVPCCLDGNGEMALGNLFDQPLDKILSNPRAQTITQGFFNRAPTEELCKRCDFATRFVK